MHSILFISVVIVVALAFDFVNGFHDASNSTATIVATGVLKPIYAVLWTAFFNFIAFLFFHLGVATTLGTGLVNTASVTPYVILSALLGAIGFSLITWYFGMPSSSSHALIGGLMGAVLAKSGPSALVYSGLIKVFAAIIISPALGMMIAFLLLGAIYKATQNIFVATLSPWARRFHLLSAALLSLGHGGNDAQKTMGIIAVLLFTSHLLGPHFNVPIWIVISCNFVMGLGTFLGGWRIAKTLGQGITKLEPLSGSVAETTSALVLFVANYLGMPVSTTHIVTGAITGVGSYHGLAQTNWVILRKVVWTWFITIPASALIAALLVAARNYV